VQSPEFKPQSHPLPIYIYIFFFFKRAQWLVGEAGGVGEVRDEMDGLTRGSSFENPWRVLSKKEPESPGC
jgi:hypothetical protein